METLGCDYTGYEFGGGYIDSCCIEGFLWDLDSCDEPGGGLTHGGEWACPRCNTRKFLSDAMQDAKDGGCGTSVRPWCAAIIWENSLLKAAAEHPEIVASFLAEIEPFNTDDWPDRKAVREGRARWSETFERRWPWPFELPQPAAGGQAARPSAGPAGGQPPAGGETAREAKQ
jgi:hypothetical protein